MPDAAPRCAARRGGLDERSTDDRRGFAVHSSLLLQTIGERIAVVPQKSIFNSTAATNSGEPGHTLDDTARTRTIRPMTHARNHSRLAHRPHQYSAIVFKIPNQSDI